MLENVVTRIWRFLKRHIAFAESLVAKLTEPLLTMFAKKEHFVLSRNENWGTRLRYVLRWYERGTVMVCKKLLRPGMNVLDIGADVGYYARLYSELVGSEGKVWAFEPHPESYGILKRNVDFLKYHNVIPVAKAISDRTEVVPFFGMSMPAKHGLFDASQINSDLSLEQKLVVESITIDDFLRGEGSPEVHLIKLDIEGAESKALAGMTRTLVRLKNLSMIVEFNFGTLSIARVDPLEFLGQLGEKGFSILAIYPDGSLRSIGDDVLRLAQEGYINLLCVRDKSLIRGFHL